jgi:hypothetical protein
MKTVRSRFQAHYRLTALLIDQIYPTHVLPHALPNDLFGHRDLSHNLTPFSNHPNGESLVLKGNALVGLEREIVHVKCFQAREAVKEATPKGEIELL